MTLDEIARILDLVEGQLISMQVRLTEVRRELERRAARADRIEMEVAQGWPPKTRRMPRDE